MLHALISTAIFAGGFALSVGAIIITVVPAIPRIRAALDGRPQPETREQHWRRVHAAGDRAPGFGGTTR